MIAPHPTSTQDLSPTERRFVSVLQQLGFGRFESLRIECGQLILDPWPTTISDVKFGASTNQPSTNAEDFALKKQVVELFAYVRSVDAGDIRTLQVRNGLPFSMEIEHSSDPVGSRHA